MLNEISQRKTNTVWYHLYMESKTYNKLMNITKEQTHRYREQTSGYQQGKGKGKGEGQYRGRELRGTKYSV